MKNDDDDMDKLTENTVKALGLVLYGTLAVIAIFVIVAVIVTVLR